MDNNYTGLKTPIVTWGRELFQNSGARWQLCVALIATSHLQAINYLLLGSLKKNTKRRF